MAISTSARVSQPLATIQEEEAQRVFDYLEEMDEMAETNELEEDDDEIY